MRVSWDEMGVDDQERRSGSVVDPFEVWVHVMDPKTQLHLTHSPKKKRGRTFALLIEDERSRKRHVFRPARGKRLWRMLIDFNPSVACPLPHPYLLLPNPLLAPPCPAPQRIQGAIEDGFPVGRLVGRPFVQEDLGGRRRPLCRARDVRGPWSCECR